MTRTTNQRFGDWGEQMAKDFLCQRGYRFLAKNVRTPYGEIDLLMLDECEQKHDGRQALVFVEVKTRSTDTFGYPEDAIGARKREHMIAAAEFYLQEHPEYSERWRIDVVSIRVKERKGKPEIAHFEDAIGEW